MDTNANYLCPRCGGMIPNDNTPGAYPGAISRIDNVTEVCSACGWDEGMRQYKGEKIQPVAEWPVTIKYRSPISFMHSDDESLLLQFGKTGDPSKKVSVYTVDAGVVNDPNGDAILMDSENLYILIPNARLDASISRHERDGKDGSTALIAALEDVLTWSRELAGSFLD